MPIDLQPSTPVALVCAVLADSAETLAAAKERLTECFGPLRAASATYDFDFTSYYEAEMGAGLRKQLVCFKQRIDPAELATVKTQTMALERAMSRGGCRRANIDPGLLSIESLVLATTKYAGHRVCIAPQLYAEVTCSISGDATGLWSGRIPTTKAMQCSVSCSICGLGCWPCAAEVSPGRRARQTRGVPARCRCGWGG